MRKIIQISECKTTVSETQKLNLQEIGCEELTKTSGYPCIIIGNKMYYDKAFNTKDELTVLVNGREPISTDFISHDIELDIPEKLCPDRMPEFGLTVSNNINVIQVNIALSELNDYLEYSIINYWNMNGCLCTGQKSHEKEKIQDIINKIAEYGYVMPMVITCDTMFKPDYYTYIYTICRILGKKEIPVRVICYKDYNYVKRLCPPLHQAIRKVPANPYFTPLDEKDYTDDFIWNYSDKRKVFDIYKNHAAIMMSNDMRRFDRDGWKPQYYIVKGHEDEIQDLVRQISLADVNTVIGRSKHQENTPFIYPAKSYLTGYEKVIDADPEEWELLLPETADKFEVYKEEDRLNPATFSVDYFRYHHECKKEIEKLLKKFDADIIIMGDRKGSALGFDDMHNLLNKEQIKVKYIRHKR